MDVRGDFFLLVRIIGLLNLGLININEIYIDKFFSGK